MNKMVETSAEENGLKIVIMKNLVQVICQVISKLKSLHSPGGLNNLNRHQPTLILWFLSATFSTLQFFCPLIL